MGVSGVPWLYMDILLWRAAALFPAPEDAVMSSTSNGLQQNRFCECMLVQVPSNQPPDCRLRKHLIITTTLHTHKVNSNPWELVWQKIRQDKRKWSRKRSPDPPKGPQISITALRTIYLYTWTINLFLHSY